MRAAVWEVVSIPANVGKDSYEQNFMVFGQGHMYGIFSEMGMVYGVLEGMGYEGKFCRIMR